jgi:hypothetical protein
MHELISLQKFQYELVKTQLNNLTEEDVTSDGFSSEDWPSKFNQAMNLASETKQKLIHAEEEMVQLKHILMKQQESLVLHGLDALDLAQEKRVCLAYFKY